VIGVRLQGGLGNQMFQYAAARRLARHHKTMLRLDTSWYSTGDRQLRRPFLLDELTLHRDVRIDRLGSPRTYLNRLRSKLQRRLASRLVHTERSQAFDRAVIDLPNGAHLVGFFQSEEYFEDVADLIRFEFEPRDPTLRARVRQGLQAYRRPAQPLVAVHVRRGDYLDVYSDQSLAIPLERINAAMERFYGAAFVVFSDDLAWCSTALAGPHVHLSPFHTAIEDLCAMTECDHNIIANSTFSWWGAWLNPRPARVVVAPLQWNGPRNSTPEPEDLVPRNWLRY
jgi:hypothetical protein